MHLLKNLLIVSLITLLVFSSCKKDKGEYVPYARCVGLTRNIDTISKYIHGNWEWVEEYRVTRYEGGHYITPDSPNSYHLTLKLSADTARFFVNNRPDSIYRFKIQRELEITNYPTDSLPVIVYYSFNTGQRKSYVQIMICRDQLLMQHQYVSSIAGERLWLKR